jgi:hypothetical protein
MKHPPAVRTNENIAQLAVKLLDCTETAAQQIRVLGLSVHTPEDPFTPFEPEHRDCRSDYFGTRDRTAVNNASASRPAPNS